MKFIKLENGDVNCVPVPNISRGVLVNSGSRFLFKANSSLISASEALAISNELSRLNNQTQWDKQNGDS